MSGTCWLCPVSPPQADWVVTFVKVPVVLWDPGGIRTALPVCSGVLGSFKTRSVWLCCDQHAIEAQGETVR